MNDFGFCPHVKPDSGAPSLMTNETQTNWFFILRTGPGVYNYLKKINLLRQQFSGIVHFYKAWWNSLICLERNLFDDYSDFFLLNWIQPQTDCVTVDSFVGNACGCTNPTRKELGNNIISESSVLWCVFIFLRKRNQWEVYTMTLVALGGTNDCKFYNQSMTQMWQQAVQNIHASLKLHEKS